MHDCPDRLGHRRGPCAQPGRPRVARHARPLLSRRLLRTAAAAALRMPKTKPVCETSDLRGRTQPGLDGPAGIRMYPLDRAPLRQRIVSLVLSMSSQESSCVAEALLARCARSSRFLRGTKKRGGRSMHPSRSTRSPSPRARSSAPLSLDSPAPCPQQQQLEAHHAQHAQPALHATKSAWICEAAQCAGAWHAACPARGRESGAAGRMDAPNIEGDAPNIEGEATKFEGEATKEFATPPCLDLQEFATPAAW